VESESEGIFGSSRIRKEFLGGIGDGRNFWVESESEGILGAVGVGRNFRWSGSRKEFLGGVGRNF
jgi:hypothetical protein